MRRILPLLALLLPLTVASAAPPLKGLVLWPDEARGNPELSREISLEFSYVCPSDLVRGFSGGAIRYDWSPLERLLDDIASRRHQAILRFRYEYPGEPLRGVRGATGVPDFVRSSPGYRETFSPNPGGDGPTYYADWSHPNLRAFTLRFFADFAARYDADPRIAFLEAGFGHWSEYHIFGTPIRPGVNFPSLDFQKAFFRKMASLFRQTPWLVSIDAASEENSLVSRDPAILALPFGLFDDSFMGRRHELSQGEGYNESCWRAFGADRWTRAPAGGEITYESASDQRNFLSPKGIHGVVFAAAAAKYHITFMIANDSVGGPFATPDRFREAAAACGYDFRLASFSLSPDGHVRFRIRNDGVAPLYHDAFPSVAGARSSQSLKGLLPGASLDFDIAPQVPPRSLRPADIRLLSPKLPASLSIPLSI